MTPHALHTSIIPMKIWYRTSTPGWLDLCLFVRKVKKKKRNTEDWNGKMYYNGMRLGRILEPFRKSKGEVQKPDPCLTLVFKGWNLPVFSNPSSQSWETLPSKSLSESMFCYQAPMVCNVTSRPSLFESIQQPLYCWGYLERTLTNIIEVQVGNLAYKHSKFQRPFL